MSAYPCRRVPKQKEEQHLCRSRKINNSKKSISIIDSIVVVSIVFNYSTQFCLHPLLVLLIRETIIVLV